ncbi:MAG: ATP synthase F1 subunit gamma [Fimbriimonadaceae bacterium]|nr:ATP synthase F1 subunit gamma [Fimbriimonadaceae bacterium]
MASLRDIRSKIGTVKNIRKITQAMKMVAAAKLRKAQEKVDAARPFADKMKELLGEVAPHVPAEVIARQPLLQTREGQRVGLVVISSDRGLCGSYNNQIIRKAQEFCQQRQAAGQVVDLITIGRKCGATLRMRGYHPQQSFPMVGVDAPYAEVQAITEAVVGLYIRADEPVSEVWIAYTEFVNAVLQNARVERFLPIEAGAVVDAGVEQPSSNVEYEYEPDAEQMLAELLPRFVDNQVYQYLLEATASEYGSRMTAMSKASDNAGELIDTLTLQYNRARQDAITKELLDIVGGAAALAEK